VSIADRGARRGLCAPYRALSCRRGLIKHASHCTAPHIPISVLSRHLINYLRVVARVDMTQPPKTRNLVNQHIYLRWSLRVVTKHIRDWPPLEIARSVVYLILWQSVMTVSLCRASFPLGSSPTRYKDSVPSVLVLANCKLSRAGQAPSFN